MEKNIYHMS